MSANTSIENKPADVFKTFPEFSKLTLGDRKKYEALIKDFPPMSEYAFPTLMSWWNTLESCAVSVLNGNLVISYWLPGSEKVSGFSLVGVDNIEESICGIFDHQRAKGEPARLVHVPEFVIGHMEHPELFKFKPERAYDEYVLAISKYYPFGHLVSYRKRRIRKFQAGVRDAKIVVKSLDLSRAENKQLLLKCVEEWPRKGINHISKHSKDAARADIDNAELIGTENVCLLVNDELHACMLYTQPADKRYIMFSYAMVKYAIPYTFDYMVYAFAEWFANRGVQYVNVDADLGLPVLRILKLALGPENYFRKYTIEPAYGGTI